VGRAQSSFSSFVRSRDIIGNENEHKSLPKECWIRIQVPAKMASQQECLGVGKQAPWTLFRQVRVLQFLPLAFLPGLDHFAPPCFC